MIARMSRAFASTQRPSWCQELPLTPFSSFSGNTPLPAAATGVGHDAIRAMVETKTRCFAAIRPAHRPRKSILSE